RLAPMSTSTPATTSPLGRLGKGAPGGRSRPKPVWSPRIVSPFLLTVDDTALAAVRCHTLWKQQSTAGASMGHEEIEVKFLIADRAAMPQRLRALAATHKTPRTYKDTWLSDTPDKQLTRQGGLLRLPRDRRNLIP